MENPLKRIVILSIASYIGMIFGTFYHICLTYGLFNYNFSSLFILYQSFMFISIIFLIMIVSLYIFLPLFKKLYYFFFLLMTLYIFMFLFSLIYLFLNIFYPFSITFNCIIYHIIPIALLIEGIYYEQDLDFEPIEINNCNFNGKIKIAHLSDMHLGAVYGKEFVQKIVDLIKSENNIDFVCITGDMIDGNIRLTSEMLEPFSQLSIPIYYVTGNHEDYTFKAEAMEIIENSNLIHLENKAITFNNKVNIIGIDYYINFSIINSNLNQLIPKNNELPNIFIHHVPILNLDELEKYNIFLMLCGHTHSGQCFPFGLLIKKCLKNNMILNGLYSYMNSRYIYCVSGCGTSGWPVRSYFSKPRIGLITLNGNILY